MKDKSMLLLVGDNPFHGISHLSQQRSRDRGVNIELADYAAKLVTTSLHNGADGFMFSVSERTLSILEALHEKEIENLKLYAIVPYAYEYVRIATQTGGFYGLGTRMLRKIAFSLDLPAMVSGLRGVARLDLADLLKTYIHYEISRIKSSAGKKADLSCVLLHELITEIGLSLDLDWLFKSYIDFMLRSGIRPGFQTRNFAFLVDRFRSWAIDFRKLTIVAPFNCIGFQMTPSKRECEEALNRVGGSNVIAMSVLAAGRLKPGEAFDYVRTLQTLRGVVVGVSKEEQARDTFTLLTKTLNA
jgi:hypothetical protein